MVFNEMYDGMYCPVNGTAILIILTEVMVYRFFLVSGNVDGMVDQFINALVLGCGDRYYRYSQHVFHSVDVYRTAIAGHLIHHVKSYDHRHVHFQ